MAIHGRLHVLAERRAAKGHPLLDRAANLLVSHVDVGRAGVHSRVPDQGVLEGALTLLPGEDLALVQREVEAAVGTQARLDWISGVSGAEVPLDGPLYRLVAQSIVEVTGQPPQVNPLHTASDIRNPIVQAAIPTVGLGPLGGDLTQNGLTDEWVDIEDYRKAVKVAAAIIDGWCGTV
jgi:acetylornithine deacetylase